LNISQGDIYQVLAYATRYKCNRIVLVYPVFKGQETTESEPYVTHTALGPVTLEVKQIDISGPHETFCQQNEATNA
jgi:5-methylcytosine-specific restriction enzyme subunit McrC